MSYVAKNQRPGRISLLFTNIYCWLRGWDSDCVRSLKTKNLMDYWFLTIRSIRTKTPVETRIEHAARSLATSVSGIEATREREGESLDARTPDRPGPS